MDEIFGVDLIDCAGDNLAAIAPIVQFPASADKRVVTCYGEVTAADFVRSGSATYTDAAGNLVLASADTPRIESSGWLLEGGATNKVTCAKSNPQALTNITKSGDAAAVLSVVNDATALAAAGLSEFGPNVYKLDNSAGTSYAYIGSGSTGNTNVHSVSVYVRGSGQVKARLTSGVGDYADLSSKYVRTKTENQTPADNARAFSVQAAAGSIVYFTLPQLEEGPVCTSPIPGGTGAITRASEGSDTSNNGLTMPLSQAMIDSLTGELLDGSSAWKHVSGTAPAYSGGNRILTYSSTLTSSDYHALNATLAIDRQVEVSYSISGYAAGSIALGFGTTAGTSRNANGTYTERGTLTANTNLYVNASGFTGVLNITSVNRVLESGQTNPGEGTIIQLVSLPWDSSLFSNDTSIVLWTAFNSTTGSRFAIRRNSSGSFFPVYLSDGFTGSNVSPTEIAAGRYALIAQWSARTSQMRVGLYNPATGILTWGNYATYRGFFPITTTGGQRMRWGYGLSGFPVGIGDNYFFNSVITDNDIKLMCQNMTT